jgi:hypothetical protein
MYADQHRATVDMRHSALSRRIRKDVATTLAMADRGVNVKRLNAIMLAVGLLSACSTDTSTDGGDDAGSISAAEEMPLGSKNPCWGGTYPDDLDGIGIPRRDVLVDTRTNDMYDSVCIAARISQYNEEWPAKMESRLVRAADL